ncbi:glycosyltransferase family 2 protein [Tropicimonas sp. IMCC34043]|uniref:glycosyltransferase family 2 protein n=1 Tax=Tropicimonas sp. IMCC34043 TaxID=2248760 RepID=UPI000E237810|nr:glycosyltransferase family 2 protein [Tropicimonas sp. IMCC34043]
MGYSLAELRKDLSNRDLRVQRWWQGLRWRHANAVALSAPPPDPALGKVVFAIPLISRRKAADWDQVQANLVATLTSLRRQGDGRWQAIVCCQDRPDAVAFDDRVRFLPYAGSDARYDNHQKYAQMRATLLREETGAGYYFQLDADDLLHPGLVGYMLSDNNRQGYLIDRGYMLDHASLDLAVLQPADSEFPEATEFYRSCGSSSALWFDLSQGADFATVLARRGNHRKVARNMGYFGFRMAMVPFHAAIYVMNHGDNLRQKRGKMAGKMMHFDVNPVTDPARRAEIAETFGFAEIFGARASD